MALKPEELKHQIYIQGPPVSTKDSVGGVSFSWTTILTSWAKIQPISTRESMLAAQSKSSITHRVTIPFANELDGIDGSWRIKTVVGNRIFSIDGVRNIDEANEVYEIVCTEGLKEI